MKVVTLATVGVAVFSAAQSRAQNPMEHATPHTSGPPVAWILGAQAIAVATVQSPAYANRTFREGYLTQPMLMGMLSAYRGHLALAGMLDFEGLTLKRGELDLGMEGEGYVDRRHPHTYLHELVASATGGMGRTRFSVAVGKGFVPFGTDDPMVRPFEKYPANHHIAQIVERLLATFAISHGPLLLEGARFNGDEPESPSDLPNSGRLWDSWAGRARVFPAPVVELQASVARVKSPELARGGGLDQRKLNLSVRYESVPPKEMPMEDAGGVVEPEMQMDGAAVGSWKRYALVEWGRSSDYDADVRAFTFTTFLAEAEVGRRRLSFAARVERTERPEEERLADPFRYQRPGNDFSILGRTRWDIVSARVSATAYRSRLGTLVPFVEIARQHASALVASQVFDPKGFYGSNTMWGFSVGLIISAGTIHRRTGQYGAARREGVGMSMGGTVRMAPVSEANPVGGSDQQ